MLYTDDGGVYGFATLEPWPQKYPPAHLPDGVASPAMPQYWPGVQGVQSLLDVKFTRIP